MPGPPEEPPSETTSSTEETHSRRRILLVSLSADDEPPASEHSALALAPTSGLEKGRTFLHVGDTGWLVFLFGEWRLFHLRESLEELRVWTLGYGRPQSLLPALSPPARSLPLVPWIEARLSSTAREVYRGRQWSRELLDQCLALVDPMWESEAGVPSVGWSTPALLLTAPLESQDTARRIAQLEAENALLKEQLEDASDAPIRKHLEAGRVAEARQLVQLLLKALPSTRLEQWAQVLAPPTARSDARAGGSDGLPTREWLREHARTYAGQWIALREGALLGADASRVSLHRRLQQNGTLEGSLFMRL